MFPDAFEARIKAQFDKDAESFLAALRHAPQTSIRLHPIKKVVMGAHQIPWCDSGYFLNERPSFSLDPLFHAGGYYVQEASSMFLKTVVNQLVSKMDGPKKVLDLCAAPGGKSTLLLECLGPDDVLIANEIIANRNTILQENITKWGYPNCMVTRADPEKFGALENQFDIICIDAPCSGEGMFRKDPQAINEWNIDNLRVCEARSKRIIADVWPALKPGGYLIYSTCTFNPEENEILLAAFINNNEAHSVQLDVDEGLTIYKGNYQGVHYYQFLPHLSKGEGFFLAVIKKTGKHPTAEVQPTSKVLKWVKHAALLNTDYNWHWIIINDLLHVRTAAAQSLFDSIGNKLYFTKSAIEIGKMIKEELLPSHELALSVALNLAICQKYEVDETIALAFLRKETNFKIEGPKGWVLLTYKELPLGWIKNLGNRINNYYPVAYRLRK